MSYPINYPKPQGANVQIFEGAGQLSGTTTFTTYDWVKPQGASIVWFTVIGGGGGGGSGNSTTGGGGGGSGAVTNCMMPAFLIPDNLIIQVGVGGAKRSTTSSTGYSGTASSIIYQQKDGTGYTLLTANPGTGGVGATSGGNGGAGGTASASNFFSAAGFFQSIAGQTGGNVGNDPTASTTTFLSGGAGGQGGTAGPSIAVTSNYGYSIPSQSYVDNTSRTNQYNGIFQTQPILVGVGGAGGQGGNGASLYAGDGGTGGFGCGGGGGGNNSASSSASGRGGAGGAGLVVIITW